MKILFVIVALAMTLSGSSVDRTCYLNVKGKKITINITATELPGKVIMIRGAYSLDVTCTGKEEGRYTYGSGRGMITSVFKNKNFSVLKIGENLMLCGNIES